MECTNSSCRRLLSRIAELEKKQAELELFVSSLQPASNVPPQDIQVSKNELPAPILRLPIEIIQHVAEYLVVEKMPFLGRMNDDVSMVDVLSLYRTCRQMRLNLQSVINSHIMKHGSQIFRKAIGASEKARVPKILPGDTILSYEIKRSYTPVLTILRDLGVPVILNQWPHDFPLSVAVWRGKMELIKFFAERDPLIDKTAEKRKELEKGGKDLESLAADVKGQALQIALTTEYEPPKLRLEIVKHLLERGANVNISKRLYPEDHLWMFYNPAPIAIAAETCNLDIAKLLIVYGADVNTNEVKETPELDPVKQPTALQYACARGDLEIFNALLAAGADIEAPACDSNDAHPEYAELTELGGTALCILAMNAHDADRSANRIATAKILLEKGAVVDPLIEKLPSDEWCNIPLFHAVWPPAERDSASGFGPLQMTMLLLSYGANKKRVQQIIKTRNTKTRNKKAVLQCVNAMFKLAKKYEGTELTTEKELVDNDAEAEKVLQNYQEQCTRDIRRPRGSIFRD